MLVTMVRDCTTAVSVRAAQASAVVQRCFDSDITTEEKVNKVVITNL